MPETRRAFHEELDDMGHSVVQLAALVSQSIEKGTQAFLDGDLEGVEVVIADDRDLDALTVSIEDRALQLLARQQPMAIDLRTVVSILRVIHELERAGDNMVNVVKAARRLHPHPLDPKVRGLLQRMREQAVNQLAVATRAFTERDPALAAALNDMDDVMDDLQKELFRWVFAARSESEDSMQQLVQLALVGRYYERIADHAVNFGERVTFMVTGSMHPE